jgi:hypothetical protein
VVLLCPNSAFSTPHSGGRPPDRTAIHWRCVCGPACCGTELSECFLSPKQTHARKEGGRRKGCAGQWDAMLVAWLLFRQTNGAHTTSHRPSQRSHAPHPARLPTFTTLTPSFRLHRSHASCRACAAVCSGDPRLRCATALVLIAAIYLSMLRARRHLTGGKVTFYPNSGRFNRPTYCVGFYCSTYDPDPYVVISLGSERWTSSKKAGQSVSWNEGKTFVNDYPVRLLHLIALSYFSCELHFRPPARSTSVSTTNSASLSLM